MVVTKQRKAGTPEGCRSHSPVRKSQRAHCLPEATLAFSQLRSWRGLMATQPSLLESHSLLSPHKDEGKLTVTSQLGGCHYRRS